MPVMNTFLLVGLTVAAAALPAQQSASAPRPEPRAAAEARAALDIERTQAARARAADAVLERALTGTRALDDRYVVRADGFGVAPAAQLAFDVAATRPNVNLTFAGQGFGYQATPQDSLYRKAHEEMNRGDYRKAATLFKELYTKYPNAEVAADAMYWQAHALYRVGTTPDLQDALTVLDQMRTKYPSPRMRGEQGDVAALQMRVAGVLFNRGMGGQALVMRTLKQSDNVCDREEQQVRAAALNALMQTDQDAAIQYAQKMLSKKDECSTELRRSAVFLLGNKRDGQAAATLISVAKNDPDYGVRSSAMGYLGRLPGDDAVNALDDLLRNGDDDRIKRDALRALARHPSPRARGLVKALVEKNDASESLRMTALDALDPERSSADDLAWLQGLYGKVDNPRIKARIISAVARIGGSQNEKWFTTLANNEDESIDVRMVALQRIAPLMDVTALGKLYEATGQRRLRGEIVNQLGNRKEAEATDKLVSIAKSGTDVELRTRAIDALVSKKDPRATKLLLELIDR
jgi:HEAT repeat protein/TolA-binding protein